MTAPEEDLIILVADDDLDDQLLIGKALKNAQLLNEINYVENGQELLDYLHRKGKFEHLAGTPLPGLILLDLNMPVVDGREALEKIKSSPDLKRIPIVILTTSKAEEDVLRTYNLGVNSFISKPVTLDGLVAVVQSLAEYWFKIVRLPK